MLCPQVALQPAGPAPQGCARASQGCGLIHLAPWPPAAALRSLLSRSSSVFLERELTLDGAIVSAVFHDSMDMGVVGTTAGTLWYISWAEGTSTRLISGHRSKVSAGPLLTQVGSLLAPSPLPMGAVSARCPRSSPRPHGLRDPACPAPLLLVYLLEKAGRPCWDPPPAGLGVPL